MECIQKIKPINGSNITQRDLCFALLVDMGCPVSGMPRDYQSRYYDCGWELFDPELVKEDEIEDLPGPWDKVFKIHNRSNMHDCIDLRYRYIHVPIKIMPSYPRVPCCGIFVIMGETEKRKEVSEITENDLIHVGNEIE